MANHYYTENPELAHDLESGLFHYVVGPFSLRPIAGLLKRNSGLWFSCVD